MTDYDRWVYLFVNMAREVVGADYDHHITSPPFLQTFHRLCLAFCLLNEILLSSQKSGNEMVLVKIPLLEFRAEARVNHLGMQK